MVPYTLNVIPVLYFYFSQKDLNRITVNGYLIILHLHKCLPFKQMICYRNIKFLRYLYHVYYIINCKKRFHSI